MFVCAGWNIKKGKTESEILTAESFTWVGLLGIKRHSECIKDRLPYNHRNEVLVLRKHCDGDFIVRDITVTLNRCRGVELWGGSHGGWEGFCSPSSKNTHSSQPCGGILKPFGGLCNLVPQRGIWITHLKEHRHSVLLAQINHGDRRWIRFTQRAWVVNHSSVP